MPASIVVYANFKSSIDGKNRHKPIMLFCLAVPAFQPSKLNCEYFIHHTRAKKTFVLSWTISHNCTRE